MSRYWEYCERCDRRGRTSSHGQRVKCPRCDGRGWKPIYDHDYVMETDNGKGIQANYQAGGGGPN